MKFESQPKERHLKYCIYEGRVTGGADAVMLGLGI